MEDRPDVCLGTDSAHTPAALLRRLEEECRSLGWSVAVDRPYKGAIVPLEMLGREPNLSAVMIELNRRLYLQGGEGLKVPGFTRVQAGVRRLLWAAADWLASLTVEDPC